ncbi:MAG: MopE-related protein [Myxococcota bacterium]
MPAPSRLALLALLALAACADGGDKDSGEPVDSATPPVDADADGFATPTDCDDTDAAVFPGADETCDGVDQDCDGTVDDGADDATPFYADTDGDTFGDALVREEACAAPTGFVADATDCDDTRADVFPGAAEVCNTRDDDCDGVIDPDSAADATWWYPDVDGDRFGRADALPVVACAPPAGWVDDATDCDDADAATNPDGVEVCNGTDDDCDGTTDPDTSLGAPTFYADTDADGFGDAGATTIACAAPDGFVADATDCDDADAGVRPDAVEVCNAVDDDCDGAVDPVTSADAPTWYADADGDGFGDADAAAIACAAPPAHVADAADCDDASAAVSPAAPEACDGADVDEDCDGVSDDADGSVTGRADWFPDADLDGFGDDTADATPLCDAPAGWAAAAGDCDDTDAERSPDGWPCTRNVTTADAALKVTGVTGGAQFAYAGWVQDYDLDGDADTLVTAYYRDGGKGAAYLLLGPDTGTVAASTADVTLADPAYTFLGYWAGRTGDLDGDGHDDMGLLASRGGFFGWYAPVVGGTTLAGADVRVTGEVQSDYHTAVAGGFDFDGDGADDLAVSNPNWSSSQGAAYVALGPFSGERSLGAAELIVRGEATADSAARGMSAGGDIDGDGLDDLLVSAHYNDAAGAYSGSAYWVRGGTTGTVNLADADGIVTGTTANEFVGDAIAGGGDVDGDGYDDFVVGGSRYNGYAGAAWLFAGPATGTRTIAAADATVPGLTAYDTVGNTLGDLSDLDGDGFADLVVGALGDYTCGSRNGSGSVWVFRGPVAGTLACEHADVVLAGTVYNGRFSQTLATPGDVDADGVPDLLVGAYLEGAGALYRFSGAELF